MDLSKILSISGKPGLFRLIAQTKTGLIVESMDDNKRIPTHMADKVNKLEDITVYTTDKDISLKDVFTNIYKKENGGPAAAGKSDDKALKTYFGEVLPQYDKEKVYMSDIKKILNWYNVLQKKDLVKPDEEKPEEPKPAEPENKEEPKII
jgi:hypothetical protein